MHVGQSDPRSVNDVRFECEAMFGQKLNYGVAPCVRLLCANFCRAVRCRYAGVIKYQRQSCLMPLALVDLT